MNTMVRRDPAPTITDMMVTDAQSPTNHQGLRCQCGQSGPLVCSQGFQTGILATDTAYHACFCFEGGNWRLHS